MKKQEITKKIIEVDSLVNKDKISIAKACKIIGLPRSTYGSRKLDSKKRNSHVKMITLPIEEKVIKKDVKILIGDPDEINRILSSLNKLSN